MRFRINLFKYLPYLLLTIIFLSPLLLRYFLGFPLFPSEFDAQFTVSNLLSSFSYNFSLPNIILSLFSYSEISFIVFSLIMSLVSLFLFNKISEHYLSENEAIISSFLFVINPLVLHVFLGRIDYGVLFLFLLLSVFLFIKTSKYLFIPLILIAFSDIALFVITILAFLFSIFFSRQSRKHLLVQFGISSLFVIISFIISNIGYLNFNTIHFFNQLFSSPNDYLLIFGGFLGLNLLLLILSLLCFTTYKRLSRPFMFFLLFFTILLVTSYFLPIIRVILLLPISILASRTLSYLSDRSWSTEIYRFLVMLLIVCILLFGSIVSVREMVSEEPFAEQISALQFLQNYDSNIIHDDFKSVTFDAKSSKHVITKSSLTPQILRFTNLKPFINRYSYSNDLSLRNAELIQYDIFMSRDSDFVFEFFINNSIKYVFIDYSMKNGLVWSKPNQGLLFVLNNDNNFKNIYNSNYVTIYEFIMPNDESNEVIEQ